MHSKTGSESSDEKIRGMALSWRQLYNSLRYIDLSGDTEGLNNQLKIKKNSIISGLSWCEKHTADTREAFLKRCTQKEAYKNFICKQSALIEISESLYEFLLTSINTYPGKGKQHDFFVNRICELANGEKGDSEDLNELSIIVQRHYLVERELTFLVMIHILRKDSNFLKKGDNATVKEIREALTSHTSEHFKRIISGLDLDITIPAAVSSVEGLRNMWIHHLHRERRTLLELIFTILCESGEIVKECGMEISLKILRNMSNPAHRYFMPSTAGVSPSSLMEEINNLSVAIVLCCLNLEGFSRVHYDSTGIAYTLPVSHTVKDLVEFQSVIEDKVEVLSRSALKEKMLYGPILLAWGLIIKILIPKLTYERPIAYSSFLDIMKPHQEIRNSNRKDKSTFCEDLKDPNNLIKFSCISCAAHEQVFTLLNISSEHGSPELCKNIKLIAKHLLMLLLDSIDFSPKFIYYNEVLNWFHCVTDKCLEVVDGWWARDYIIPYRRSILDAVRTLYLLDVSKMCKIFKSLSCSPQSAYNCYLYLSNMDFLSISVDACASCYIKASESPDQTIALDNTNSVIPHANTFPLIPPSGVVVKKLEKIIYFPNWKHSAWHYFVSILDSFSSRFKFISGKSYRSNPGHIFNSVKNEDNIISCLNVVESIIGLVSAVVKNLDQSSGIAEFSAHIANHPGATSNNPVVEHKLCPLFKIFVDITTTLVSTGNPSYYKLFISCMDVLRSMLPHMNDDAWRIILDSKLFPENPNSVFPMVCYISDILIKEEFTKGDCDATLALLKFVNSLIESSQRIKFDTSHTNSDMDAKKASSILSLIIFTLFNIIPSMNSRRCKTFQHKIRLSSWVLRILNKVMNDTTWDPYLHSRLNSTEGTYSNPERPHYRDISNSQYNNIQRVILGVLLGENDNGQIKPLLQVVAELGSFLEGQVILQDCSLALEAVGVCLDALEFIRTILVKRNEQSLCSPALDNHVHFTNLEPQGHHQINFIQILKQFLLHEDCPRLQLISMEILGLLLFVRRHKSKPGSSSPFYKCVGANLLDVSKTVANLSKHTQTSRVVEHDFYFSTYENALLDFLVSAIHEDPLITQVLLGCEDRTKDLSEIRNPPSQNLCPLLEHVIDIIVDYSNHKNNVSPKLAASILCSLDNVWQNEATCLDIISSLRKVPKLFTAFEKIVERLYSGKALGGEDPGPKPSEDLSTYCYSTFAGIFVLRILIQEFYITRHDDSSRSSDECANILRIVLKKARQKYGDGKPIINDRSILGNFVELVRLSKDLEKYQILNIHTLEYFGLPEHPWTRNRTRGFGIHYYHNLELLRTKLVGEQAEEIFKIVERINCCKSLIDTHWNQFKTWELLVDVVASIDPVACPSKLKKIDVNKDWAYELAIKLADIVIEENNADPYTVAYLGNVCRTIKTLIFFWVDQLSNELPEHFSCPSKSAALRATRTKSRGTNAHVETVLNDGVNLLYCLSKCLKVSTYNLGPSGVLSEYDFYRSIFSSILKVLSVFDPKAPPQSEKLRKPLMHIMPAAYMGLSFILRGLHVDAKSCNMNDAILMLAVISEIVPSDGNPENEKFWISVLDDYNIVDNILLALCNILNFPILKYPDLLNAILESILSSSMVPQFSKKIQDADMWRIFCKGSIFKLQCSNNARTQLPTEQAYPTSNKKSLSTESHIPIENVPKLLGNMHDPLYGVWCNILSISSHFVNSWGYFPEYMSKALSLLAQYEDQITNTLEQAIPLPDMDTELLLRLIYHNHDDILDILKKYSLSDNVPHNDDAADESIFLSPIVEIDRITTLFLCLAKWVSCDEGLLPDCSSVLNVYQDYALSILSSFIILFESPNELYLRTGIDAVRYRLSLHEDNGKKKIAKLSPVDIIEILRQDSTDSVSRYCMKAVRTMIKVTQTILLHLSICCSAMKVIMVKDFKKCTNLPKNIFHSTILVHTNLPGATLGCLFDLVRTLSKFIMHISGSAEGDFYKANPKEASSNAHNTSSAKTKGYPALFYLSALTYPIEEFFFMAEKALILAVTQIVLYKYNVSVPLNRRIEDLRELTSELRSTIKMFVDSIEILEKSSYAKTKCADADKFLGYCKTTLEFANLIEDFRSREVSDL